MYQKWLEAFYYVATEGGFTAAARKLNIGQPTVSSHVGNLEGYFGVELFHRMGRNIQLTEVGRKLYDITHDLFGHEQEAVAFLTALKNFEQGELNFSAVGPYDVMELLAAFRDHRPGIKCAVRLTIIDEVIEDLHEFRADIGIVGRDCASETVHSVFYNQHRVLIVVNQAHPLAARRKIQIADLDGEPMIVRKSSSTTQAAFDQAAAEAGVSVVSAFEIESREGLREAIIRGLGVGVISETEFAPHPALSALEVSDAKMFTRAYIACLKARQNRPLISEFFTLAKRLSDSRGG